MPFNDYSKNNLFVLLKLEDRFLGGKIFLTFCLSLVLIISLFFIPIKTSISLKGVTKCDDKNCLINLVVPTELTKFIESQKVIKLKENELILDVTLDSPEVINEKMTINNMTLKVSNKHLKNNEVVTFSIDKEKELLGIILLKTWKGGET